MADGKAHHIKSTRRHVGSEVRVPGSIHEHYIEHGSEFLQLRAGNIRRRKCRQTDGFCTPVRLTYNNQIGFNSAKKRKNYLECASFIWTYN